MPAPLIWEPITITRIDSDHYIVGAVHLVRTDKPGARWEARPHNDPDERPLFSGADLEEIMQMAHGACEMMRPAEQGRYRYDGMGQE